MTNRLIFSIGDTAITINNTPINITQYPKHYIYLQALRFQRIDDRYKVEIDLTSQFENANINPMLVFATTTNFILINFNSNTSENEIHDLVDIAYNKHLKSLEEMVWHKNYRDKLNTSPDTIRFTDHISNAITIYWK